MVCLGLIVVGIGAEESMGFDVDALRSRCVKQNMSIEVVEWVSVCWARIVRAMMGIWMSMWVWEESRGRDCVREMLVEMGRVMEDERIALVGGRVLVAMIKVVKIVTGLWKR